MMVCQYYHKNEIWFGHRYSKMVIESSEPCNCGLVGT